MTSCATVRPCSCPWSWKAKPYLVDTIEGKFIGDTEKEDISFMDSEAEKLTCFPDKNIESLKFNIERLKLKEKYQ